MSKEITVSFISDKTSEENLKILMGKLQDMSPDTSDARKKDNIQYELGTTSNPYRMLVTHGDEVVHVKLLNVGAFNKVDSDYFRADGGFVVLSSYPSVQSRSSLNTFKHDTPSASIRGIFSELQDMSRFDDKVIVVFVKKDLKNLQILRHEFEGENVEIEELDLNDDVAILRHFVAFLSLSLRIKEQRDLENLVIHRRLEALRVKKELEEKRRLEKQQKIMKLESWEEQLMQQEKQLAAWEERLVRWEERLIQREQ